MEIEAQKRLGPLARPRHLRIETRRGIDANYVFVYLKHNIHNRKILKYIKIKVELVHTLGSTQAIVRIKRVVSASPELGTLVAAFSFLARIIVRIMGA